MNAIFSFVHCLNELSNSLGPFASWAELFTFITEYSYFVFLRLTLTGSQTTAPYAPLSETKDRRISSVLLTHNGGTSNPGLFKKKILLHPVFMVSRDR